MFGELRRDEERCGDGGPVGKRMWVRWYSIGSKFEYCVDQELFLRR